MHRAAALLVAVLSFLASAGCSGVHAIAHQGVPVRSVADMQAELAAQPGPPTLPAQGVIVRLPAGSRLPLKLKVETPLGVVEPGDNRVRFDRDVFVFVSSREMALSPDGERWASVDNWKAIARLFGGGRGGSFQVGVGLTREEGAAVSIAVVANPARRE